ncbi:MAG: hypothetical protein ACPG4W_03050 [Flavobacteriales bacterium]
MSGTPCSQFSDFLEQFDLPLKSRSTAIGTQFEVQYQNQLFKFQFIDFRQSFKIHQSDYQNVILIWEDFWMLKTDILKHSIKGLFGQLNRIHGRKTEIKSISKEAAHVFFEQHHLYSPLVGKYRLACFFDDEPVALMSFSSGKNWKEKKGKSYEILRFCNASPYRVQGGFSKLLNHFKAIHQPVQLMTYSASIFQPSNLYENTGFQWSASRLLQFWLDKSELKRYVSKPEIETKNLIEISGLASRKYVWEA